MKLILAISLKGRSKSETLILKPSEKKCGKACGEKRKDKGKILWQSNVQIPSRWKQIQGVTVMGLAAVREASLETKPDAYDAMTYVFRARKQG